MVGSIKAQYGEGLGLLVKKDTRYGHCCSRCLATTGRVPGVAGPAVENCEGGDVVASRPQPVRHVESTARLVEGNPEIGREKASIGHRPIGAQRDAFLALHFLPSITEMV